MIDETFRQISTRETAQQYQQYMNGRRKQIEKEKKQEFEESLRNSINRTTQSNSALFGASRNIFETALTKDTAKVLGFMERKRKMQITMASMINDLDDDAFTRFEGTMIEFNLSK